jgi:3'-phosphoadenosine 5'-phosphosulfate sulfotransferase (PAPS reductase)/FAD synthetase
VHVVALSGGKDSTAMALRLAEVEPRDYTYICTPTGDELPEMFEHWKRLGEMLGAPVQPVMGGSLKGLVGKWNALPNWRQRWCTRVLKIEPFAAWMMKQPKPLTSYVGLRADEPERDGGDYTAVPDVTLRFPLREWGWDLSDVMGYLDQRGVRIPERTDCGRCFFQTLGEWWRLWKDHPDVYADAEADEAATGHTWRSPGRDDWPTSLVDLRKHFEAGHIPRGNPAQFDMFRGLRCRVCRT